jgi:hypothetical protein
MRSAGTTKDWSQGLLKLMLSTVAATGNPCRKHRNIIRIKCHQVGAITGSKLSEHMLKADKSCRICRRKTQRIR